MNKRYLKPATNVVGLLPANIICSSNQVKTITSGAGFTNGGGGDGTEEGGGAPRSRGIGGWDDEE